MEHLAPTTSVLEGSASSALPAGLVRQKYLSLTTYRRDGRGVATSVWFVSDGGRIYVFTGDTTGKARRLRRDPRVTLGPSDGRGRLRGGTFEGVAAIEAAEEEPDIVALFDRKYGAARPVMTFLWRLAGFLSRRPTGHEICLVITPAG